MLRKFLAVTALLVFVAPTQAGVLSSMLDFYSAFDGTQDTLKASSSKVNILDQDSSAGPAGPLPPAANSAFSLGDVFYGFVEFNELTVGDDPLGTGTDRPISPFGSLAAVFSAEIDFIDGAGNIFFGAVDGLDASSVAHSTTNAGLNLKSLLGPTLAPALSADSIFAILGNTADIVTTTFKETATVSRSLGEQSTAASSGVTTPNGLLNFDATWNVEVVGNISGLTDFLVFTGATTVSGTQTGGFEVTSAPGFGPVTWLPVDTQATPIGLPTGGTSDVSLNLTLVNPVLPTPSSSGFGYTGNANFTFNAIPEPTSALAFAVMGIAGLAVRRRRA